MEPGRMTKPDNARPSRNVLSAVPYLAALDSTTFEVMARAAVRREYEPGEVVFLEGEPCAGLYIVESGWLKSIKVSPSGREQVIRFVGPGEVFNEVAILVGSPNLVTIIALEASVVWVLPRERILELLDAHPAMARIVAQQMAERALYLVHLVEDLSLRTVEARLAHVLLEQAQGDEIRRQRWSTQTEMASRLGTVPDVLNRALRNLVEAELIEVERQQIRILDREGLEERSKLGV